MLTTALNEMLKFLNAARLIFIWLRGPRIQGWVKLELFLFSNFMGWN